MNDETSAGLMFNAREHLENVLKAGGIEITDGGMLMDEESPRADIGILIDGQPFGLQLRWRTP